MSKYAQIKISLSDSKGNELKEGDKITNGKVSFIIQWNPGFFAFMCYKLPMQESHKFLYELADIIEEKYWKI